MTARPVTLIGISCDGCDAVLLDPVRMGPAAFGSRHDVRVAHQQVIGLRASFPAGTVAVEGISLHHWQFPDWSIGDEDGLDFCPGCTRMRS